MKATLYHPRPERFWRFRLKTVFVAIVILSVPLSWIGSTLHWVRERQELRRTVFMNYILNPSMGSKPESLKPMPAVIRYFGESPVSEMFVDVSVSDRDYLRVVNAYPEANVRRSNLREEFSPANSWKRFFVRLLSR